MNKPANNITAAADERMAPIVEELRKTAVYGHKVFSDASLERPAHGKTLWTFRVALDQIASGDAAIAASRAQGYGYISSNALNGPALQAAKTVIRKYTPAMRNVRHYQIQLTP